MRYSVSVSDLAYEQYDKFLDYIYHTLLNPQAADSLMQDFDATIGILGMQEFWILPKRTFKKAGIS